MNCVALREHPTHLLALTSLLPAKFDELLAAFAPVWERYHRYHTLNGELRQFSAHRERANATLAGSDYKLFFIIIYLMSNVL